MKTFDVIIQGAGASGLWCAMTAAKRGLSVCIVDHETKAGKKIRIAGGGKGNLTNLELSATNYIGKNPHFCKSALARLTQWDIVEFLANHNIPWEEREHGQLFCTTSASDMVRALIDECARNNVTILLNRTITHTRHESGAFIVETSTDTLQGTSLVIALGGPAWPQAGATDQGHRVAKQFGHNIVSPYPALVPLVMSPDAPKAVSEGTQAQSAAVEQWNLEGLQGIALPATIQVASKHYTENLLFTHNGISGPVVLQASCHWTKGRTININFLPQNDILSIMDEANSKALLKTVLGRNLPARLAEKLLPANIQEKQLAQLSKKERALIARKIHNYTVVPLRTGGFKKAEVTGGGVDTTHISSKTMESSLQKGLYFIGEVVDITGELGGFNLHWAWASGFACATSIDTDSSA